MWVTEGLVVLGPVIEEGPAVEPDHVGELPGGEARRAAALGKAGAAEQAEEVELALAAQDYAAAAELFGEAALALPTGDRDGAWRFNLNRADALQLHGERIGSAWRHH